MNADLSSTSSRRIAVIGAGVSGLIAAKCLRDEGLMPVVFEQSKRLGGIWNLDESLPDGGSIAYRSLRTNTSRQLMELSDFRFKDDLPDFPARAAVLDYFLSYADYFNLHPFIQLRTHVTSATPTADGRWEVTTLSEGRSRSELFDGLVVASGRDAEPIWVHFSGEETFTGKLLHSSGYKDPDGFAGQCVIVVGMGSSAADIAVDISSTARSTYLSTRRGGWVFPRTIAGRPWDHRLTRFSNAIPRRLRLLIQKRLILAEYRRMGLAGRMSAWDIPEPVFDPLQSRFTSSSDLIPAIARGGLAVKPPIDHIDGNTVVFADGAHIPADAIVLCTGYAMRFPFLAEADNPIHDQRPDLYLRVFHPERKKLAFLNMVTATGPLPPISEMQARWVARVFSGRATLPHAARMRAEIAKYRQQNGPHATRVDYIKYMDRLAGLIGARPSFWRNPLKWGRYLGGPFMSAQFRSQRKS